MTSYSGKNGLEIGFRIFLRTNLRQAKAKTAQLIRKASILLGGTADGIESWGMPFPEQNKILQLNREFHNKHTGQRCFVIGNGPSLARQNLCLLKNEVAFAVSGFYKHPIVKEWQPTYYTILDHLFFDGSDSSDLFFQDLRNHIYSSTFFMPLHERPLIMCRKLIPESQTRYVRCSGKIDNRCFPSIDISKPIGCGASVTILSIMLAIYMGCNPIYLIGMDHDWLAHRGEDRHFYKGKTLENHPKAHGNLALIPYMSELENNLRLWKEYEALKRISQQLGLQIINATDKGFLDVFIRTDFASLFEPIH